MKRYDWRWSGLTSARIEIYDRRNDRFLLTTDNTHTAEKVVEALNACEDRKQEAIKLIRDSYPKIDYAPGEAERELRRLYGDNPHAS